MAMLPDHPFDARSGLRGARVFLTDALSAVNQIIDRDVDRDGTIDRELALSLRLDLSAESTLHAIAEAALHMQRAISAGQAIAAAREPVEREAARAEMEKAA